MSLKCIYYYKIKQFLRNKIITSLKITNPNFKWIARKKRNIERNIILRLFQT